MARVEWWQFVRDELRRSVRVEPESHRASMCTGVESRPARSAAEQPDVEHRGQAVVARWPGCRRRVLLAVARPHHLDTSAAVLRGADDVGLQLRKARPICVSILDRPNEPVTQLRDKRCSCLRLLHPVPLCDLPAGPRSRSRSSTDRDPSLTFPRATSSRTPSALGLAPPRVNTVTTEADD